MSIFTLASRSITEQIELIERGLPGKTLTEIATMLGLPKQRIIESLKFARRTTSDREKARFTAEESERLMRILRVRELARELFATDEAVSQWLSTPDRSLGGKTPMDMLSTDIGTAKVENLVRAMTHGVPI